MSDNSFACPYCWSLVAISKETHRCDHITTFNKVPNQFSSPPSIASPSLVHDTIFFDIYFCKNCNKETIIASADSPNFGTFTIPFIPQSFAKKLPEYIPAEIRSDYDEAHAIARLSPKAAATLARRCLQGMIHDFWHIHEKNLNAEITKLKNHISQKQWEAIDTVRKVGNIGAHMDAPSSQIITVETDEVLVLLKLIEALISEWYIHRHDEEQLLSSVIQIGQKKEDQCNLSKRIGSSPD